MRTHRTNRWLGVIAASAVLVGAVALAAITAPSSVSAAGDPSARGASDPAESPPEFTGSKQISRTHLVGGTDQLVEQRTFEVAVSNTSNLRGHQMVDVSWSGAHPTGGILPDPNSGTSSRDEYPVVLLECAGTDADGVPAAQRLTPETCWTATPNERFQNSGVGVAFPPYRVDRYAEPADRRAVVGEPQPRPGECSVPGASERWVHFRTLAGADYPYGPAGGCGGLPSEAVTVGDTLSSPSNTTYATTELDGRGSVKFDVWTNEENASLGCSQTTACSLVVVPILGISCDIDAAALPPEDRPAPGEEADAARTACELQGQFPAGERSFVGKSYDLTVSGALWWSASNWRNRITVPLQFAPPSNVCEILGGTDGIDLYGSELMAQATAQWSPRFCLDPSLFKFKHVQTPEPQARAALALGTVQGVLSSSAPEDGFPLPAVNAPVAMTGFAVSFTIDDGEKQRLERLRLTPRLLAKLLTQSYPADAYVRLQYEALGHNPLDLTSDPEFQLLNPDAPQGIGNSVSASTLVTISSDSDVMWALTSYINSDPEARSFLEGTPDPWGMTVNPAYREIPLPTAAWPLLDSFVPQFTEPANACLFYNPVPYMPLVAAPLARLFQIAQSLQFAIANSTTRCHQPVEGVIEQARLKPIGREFPGFRFMVGITSLADAERYGLDTAELQTRSTVPSDAQFSDAEGRTFVAADDDGLRAAVAALQPDPITRSWPLSYATIRDGANAAGAYPGAMLVYAQVPTTGLPADQAEAFATFLRFAVTDGQQPGYGNGQLPPGYLPLTAANGLGDLAAYTQRAADAVEAQKGAVPDLVPAAPSVEETVATDVEVPTVSTAAPPVGAQPFVYDDVPAHVSDQSDSNEVAELTTTKQPPATAAPKTKGIVATLSYLARLLGRLLPWLIITAVVAGAAAVGVFTTARVRQGKSET